jgi:hypothetical protein
MAQATGQERRPVAHVLASQPYRRGRNRPRTMKMRMHVKRLGSGRPPASHHTPFTTAVRTPSDMACYSRKWSMRSESGNAPRCTIGAPGRLFATPAQFPVRFCTRVEMQHPARARLRLPGARRSQLLTARGSTQSEGEIFRPSTLIGFVNLKRRGRARSGEPLSATPHICRITTRIVRGPAQGPQNSCTSIEKHPACD